MRPKKRKLWSPEDMRRAIEAVRAKQLGTRAAAKQYGVPRSTLKDKVNAEGSVDPETLANSKLGRKPVLTGEIEGSLVKYCLQMEQLFFGLRAKDVMKMAFTLAERNNLPHAFNKDKRMAGWKWFRGFMRRNPSISLRSPQATSLARVKGFNKESVTKFFDIYEPLLDKVKNQPHRIYNVDETGLTVVQNKTSKVVGLKGKKQIGAISSQERGSLITVVTCMSATGHYVPPLLVFPRVNMKQELMDGAPNGSIAACHKSGWIQTDIFLRWFKDLFIQNAKPSKEDPVLLVLNGHYTHTRNIELLDMAKENGVDIICLPPHCTHKMQPLDRSFMFPLKTYYSQAIETWLKQHPGRPVTHYQVAALLGEAYNKAATVSNAAGGFKCSGLFPCDRNIFQDFEYCQVSSSDQEEHANGENVGETPSPSPTPTPSPLPTPSPTPSAPVSSPILPEHISPVPVITFQSTNGRRHGRQSCGATLITSTPYKNKLAEDLERINSKKGQQKSLFPSTSRNKKTEKTNKNLHSQSSSSLSSRKRNKLVDTSSSSDGEISLVSTDDEDSEEDDWECKFCQEKYSNDKKGEKCIK